MALYRNGIIFTRISSRLQTVNSFGVPFTVHLITLAHQGIGSHHDIATLKPSFNASSLSGSPGSLSR